MATYYVMCHGIVDLDLVTLVILVTFNEFQPGITLQTRPLNISYSFSQKRFLLLSHPSGHGMS